MPKDNEMETVLAKPSVEVYGESSLKEVRMFIISLPSDLVYIIGVTDKNDSADNRNTAHIHGIRYELSKPAFIGMHPTQTGYSFTPLRFVENNLTLFGHNLVGTFIAADNIATQYLKWLQSLT